MSSLFSSALGQGRVYPLTAQEGLKETNGNTPFLKHQLNGSTVSGDQLLHSTDCLRYKHQLIIVTQRGTTVPDMSRKAHSFSVK